MRKRFLFFFLVTYLFDLYAQRMPAKLYISACPGGAVDLEIASGDAGFFIPENLEESLGAATVANKNDTDGDHWIDVEDPIIKSTNVQSGVGQDFDPDLMKLTIYKPTGCISTQDIKITVVKGLVKFYESPSKEGKIDKLEFKCKDLPKHMYIEATDNSTTIRDIEIEMKYNNITDKVNATAIWINKTAHWVTRCPTVSPCDQSANNTKPGEGLLANLNDGDVQDIIAERISKDGSRYGHGYNNKNNNGLPRDENFGGRILFEFSIIPNLLPSDYANLGISFDCTRRRTSRVLQSAHGKKPTATAVEPFPEGVDDVNDDGSSTGEDNIPLNGSIYSWDAPAIPLYVFGGGIDNSLSFKAVKSSFEEFVRVGIWNPIPPNGNGLFGTRASEKIFWHSVLYTRSGFNYLMEPDIQAASVSQIKEKEGGSGNSGNGTCSVQLGNTPITEGYSFIYNSSVWKINGNSLTENPVGTWQYVGNNITVTITKGNISFYDGDKFEFSVFVSNKKLNDTSLSNYNDINSEF